MEVLATSAQKQRWLRPLVEGKDIRAFRIYDGPSEVHRWTIARCLLHPG
jgi:alkylation response protein AidB-like acyl-CoA dehydrogenase